MYNIYIAAAAVCMHCTQYVSVLVPCECVLLKTAAPYMCSNCYATDYATIADCKPSKIPFLANCQDAMREDFQRRLQRKGGRKDISEFIHSNRYKYAWLLYMQ